MRNPMRIWLLAALLELTVGTPWGEVTPHFGPLWYITGWRDEKWPCSLRAWLTGFGVHVPSLYVLLSFYLGTGRTLISVCWVLLLAAPFKSQGGWQSWINSLSIQRACDLDNHSNPPKKHTAFPGPAPLAPALRR